MAKEKEEVKVGGSLTGTKLMSLSALTGTKLLPLSSLAKIMPPDHFSKIVDAWINECAIDDSKRKNIENIIAPDASNKKDNQKIFEELCGLDYPEINEFLTHLQVNISNSLYHPDDVGFSGDID